MSGARVVRLRIKAASCELGQSLDASACNAAVLRKWFKALAKIAFPSACGIARPRDAYSPMLCNVLFHTNLAT